MIARANLTPAARPSPPRACLNAYAASSPTSRGAWCNGYPLFGPAEAALEKRVLSVKTLELMIVNALSW
jgi:hypothetical protein